MGTRPNVFVSYRYRCDGFEVFSLSVLAPAHLTDERKDIRGGLSAEDSMEGVSVVVLQLLLFSNLN